MVRTARDRSWLHSNGTREITTLPSLAFFNRKASPANCQSHKPAPNRYLTAKEFGFPTTEALNCFNVLTKHGVVVFSGKNARHTLPKKRRKSFARSPKVCHYNTIVISWTSFFNKANFLVASLNNVLLCKNSEYKE